MSRILVIDNYDSFVYNLVHYLRELEQEVLVLRNDKFELDSISEFDRVLLSPGPGIPSEAGKMMDLIEYNLDRNDCIPMLGVCLGHQALGLALGGTLRNLEEVYHGIASSITIENDTALYKGIKTPLTVGRYHSWVVDLPISSELRITGKDDQGNVMSFEHSDKPILGVQYHPESILTNNGKELLTNWLNS